MTTDTLTIPQLTTIIEALLFVASEPVTVKNLAAAIECDVKDVETALEQLKEFNHSRGVRLQRQGDKIQLVSAPELTDYIERFLGANRYRQTFNTRPGNPGHCSLSPTHYPPANRDDSRR